MKYLLLSFALLPYYAFAQDDEFSLDQEYALAPDGTIELTCDDAEVRIVGSDRATAHVVIYRKLTTKGIVNNDQTFDVRVSEQDGNLIIEEEQQGGISVVGYVDEEYTIDIEAPQGVSLQVRSDDGNVRIERVGGAISLQNDDGDVQLQDCTGASFDLRVDDGDISMNQGQGVLRVSTDDGDVTVKDGAFTAINVSVDDGDVALATTLSDDGEYDIVANDGGVDLQVIGGGGTIEVRHDDSDLDTSGQFTLVKSSDDYTELSLPDGNARVNLRVDDE